MRDYVHVTDLAQAHLVGLEYMQKNKGFSAFNLGNGDGFSVFDVIKAAEQVVGESIEYKITPKRDGDPSVLVADSLRAVSMLGWLPSSIDLTSIIKSAWRWHKNFEDAKL